MSEYMFGVGRRKPSDEELEKIEKVAQECAAVFVQVNLPGTGYQHWFAVRNYGEPFNRQKEREVLDLLAASGIDLRSS